jgi:hypothetical protein
MDSWNDPRREGFCRIDRHSPRSTLRRIIGERPVVRTAGNFAAHVSDLGLSVTAISNSTSKIVNSAGESYRGHLRGCRTMTFRLLSPVMQAVNGLRKLGRRSSELRERQAAGERAMVSRTAGSPTARFAERLAYLLDLAGSDAAGADMHADVGTIGTQRLDALEVRLGYFLRSIVRMAHLVAAQRALATYLTCTCHGMSS